MIQRLRRLARNSSYAIEFLACFLTLYASAAELVGRVVAVADGDTLPVDRTQVRVRLAEIDAPERKQPFGTRSRQSLHALCRGKDARVQDEGKDRYGRVIGRVRCDGTDANAEQVRLGMAWVYDCYARRDLALHES